MAARLHGFPGTWEFSGGKTAASADRAAVPAGRPASPGQLTDDAQIGWRHSRRFDARSRAGPGLRLNAAGRLPRRSVSGSPDRCRLVIVIVPGQAVRPACRVLVSLTGTLTLEGLLGAVISAIRRG